ncbi:hypothetical protein [Gilvibacter sp.]|uniref:hypothetical protein n=1 Tax=Gilvibacter sp. TaxID=2729997 RepID=UPI0025BE4EB9|nr:hypothetical protein [Gilvibacter sp.]NQX77520.1 hypothetical protein [Gilvibacter sp.]
MVTTYTATNNRNPKQVFPSVTEEEKQRLEEASPNQYTFVVNEVPVVPNEIKIAGPENNTEEAAKKPSRAKKTAK